MPTNPTPTQQETLERCVNCNEEIFQSREGWIHNRSGTADRHRCFLYAVPDRRAAIAGPRGDDVDAERLAATVVALWRAENSDDRTLVKYIKQSLLGARIGAAATSSPTPAESEDDALVYYHDEVAATDPEIKWVRYSDYERLKRERDGLRESGRALTGDMLGGI